MIQYVGPYLTITFEKSKNRLVQFWTKSPENSDAFKREMLEFILAFKAIKPAQVLWIQENMTVFIDNETKTWIEKHINIPALAQNSLSFNDMGAISVAFVMSKKITTHIEVIDVFEGEVKSCMTPTHFTTEQGARNWLDKTTAIDTKQNEIDVTYKGTDAKGKMVIEFTADSIDISQTLKTIKHAINSANFINQNQQKYDLLTKREIDVLRLYSTGKKHQDIANELHLSIHTVRTHWRNIKRKIGVHSNIKAFLFAQSFHPKNTQY